MTVQPGDLLREPSQEARAGSRLAHYMRWLEGKGRRFGEYDDLWQWSVTDQVGFWSSLWDYFEIEAATPYDEVLPENPTMPEARFFRGARLNYVHHALRHFHGDSPVVLAYSQTRAPTSLTIGELRDLVGRARAGLQRLGVGAGDRVAAYMPNIPETLVTFLATASLGAVFSSCSPEFGRRSVLDRFAQIEPTVLVAVDGYRYGEKEIDRRTELAEIRKGLPTVRHVVHVPYLGGKVDDVVVWEDLLSDPVPLAIDPVDFDHPLYVLYSSGTTGVPKAIVHTHGGICIEHLKNHAFGWDLRPGDRMGWFTTTAWMMWNALVSSLLCGTSIIQLDGSPIYPDLHWQWRLAEETQATFYGVSSTYLMACRREGIPLSSFDLKLRQLCCAGSPLPVDGFVYASEELGADCMLNVGNGGTDLCSGIVQGNPLLPVYAGEIAGKCLGVAAYAFDAQGRPVTDELGELVITKPLPSMPLGFWNDPGQVRYRAAYFDHYPGIWRHGDWILVRPRGSSIVSGRSDATLNRGGVRLGTSEFYAVLADCQGIDDSLVIHLEDESGGPGELLLFVKLSEGTELTDQLRAALAGALREQLSPRHAPDTIVAVPAIPYTLTGKKLEVPVKRILQGVELSKVASVDALADPDALGCYVEIAAGRSATGG
ncbi:MAG: acetoacetate--CoA ligase [Acidimicrobiales bacterium]